MKTKLILIDISSNTYIYIYIYRVLQFFKYLFINLNIGFSLYYFKIHSFSIFNINYLLKLIS